MAYHSPDAPGFRFRQYLGRSGRSVMGYFKRTDKLFWLIMLSVSAYSLLLLYTIPANATGRNYFQVQLIAIIAGYVGAFILTLVDYRVISRAWIWLIAISTALIIYTLVFGTSITGSDGINARAWLSLPGGITFQTSELVKIFFLITFGRHLAVLNERNLIHKFLHVCLLILHAAVPILLVHIQGDDGAAIIFFFMALFMALAGGVQLRYFAGMFAVFIGAVPLIWQFVLEDYQKTRILNMMNPDADPLGAGLQQIQGRISIGSGRLTGQGLLTAQRVQNSVVPVQESDFIFSVAGEELGFIGCAAILILLMLLLFKILRIASVSCDRLGSCIAFGFFGMIAAQTVFNIAMCLSLLPVMGVTLPFFSAGGSSAACLYLGFGLVQNVAMHKSERDTIRPDSIQRYRKKASQQYYN